MNNSSAKNRLPESSVSNGLKRAGKQRKSVRGTLELTRLAFICAERQQRQEAATHRSGSVAHRAAVRLADEFLEYRVTRWGLTRGDSEDDDDDQTWRFESV